MTRHQRQLDELRALCRSGRLARAVDLAFEHVAAFGRDDQVVALLIDAAREGGATAEVRAQLAALIGDEARGVGRSGVPG
jgi:hypothetical protein